MRIIAFVNKNSGPAYHRIIAPLMLMDGPDVYITNNLQEDTFEKGCDILMYNRIIPTDALDQIRVLQKKHGFKVCVDIDDWWHLDQHHILHEEYQESEFARHQIQQITNADFVTTTHERLAAEIRELNPNVHILPNAIPKAGQFDIEREKHHLTRLFWQGSITHRADIGILTRPISSLAGIAGKIKMVMAGYHPDNEEWYKMVMAYTAGGKHQYSLIHGAHVAKYYESYKHADICLVPLVNSPFNRMKSNLKVLEAANLGLPVICSKVHPYMDLPVFYATNSDEWVRHITRLVKSKNRQRDAGAELKAFCDEYFNFRKINRERQQVFEYYSNKEQYETRK